MALSWKKSISFKYNAAQSIRTYQEVGKFLAPTANIVRIRIGVMREMLQAAIEGFEGAGVGPGDGGSRG